jgi:cytochrome P450
MTTAVFLGSETARNKDWLKLSIQYPMDIFSIAFLLRMVPTWTHPVIARLLPWGYRVKSHRSKARVMIQSLMERRQKDLQAGSDVEHTILGWMTDNAKNSEADYAEMTSRQLVLTLGSIHTTALALSHALYDLCAHPEYVQPLREEIERVSKQYTADDFVKYGLHRLEKLDSFLVESQRFHPPVLSKCARSDFLVPDTN